MSPQRASPTQIQDRRPYHYLVDLQLFTTFRIVCSHDSLMFRREHRKSGNKFLRAQDLSSSGV